jgi:chemotaxis protein MotB
MKRHLLLLLLLPIALSSLGCIPQEKYDDLLTAYRAKERQNIQTQSEMESMQQNESMLRGQLQKSVTDLDEAISQLDDQNGEITRLRGDFEAMLDTVSGLNTGPLPADLNAALVRLASQNSELLSFDERTGMLRFSSDLTFDLGSTTLNPAAKQAIAALASILEGGDAAGFEIRVVGHTDNMPISKPDTRAKHPTNMHLSTHRAISVRDALVADGIAANRVQVAGYGEFRPVAENGTRGSATNRRVEIFLTPMPAVIETTAAPTPTENTDAPAPDSGEIEPLK